MAWSDSCEWDSNRWCLVRIDAKPRQGIAETALQPEGLTPQLDSKWLNVVGARLNDRPGKKCTLLHIHMQDSSNIAPDVMAILRVHGSLKRPGHFRPAEHFLSFPLPILAISKNE